MAGNGGYKHRKRKLDRKKTGRALAAKENIRRVRNKFESKGQTWDPENNPAQQAELTHVGRRAIARSKFDLF